jgi:hypothetical protein
MKVSRDDHPKPTVHGDDALNSAPADASGIFGGGSELGAIDMVDAEEVPDPRHDKKCSQGAALRRGTEKKRVRGYETRRRLIDLHVFGGKRLMECSRELSISYGRTHAVWRSVVAEVHGSPGTNVEHLQSVRSYLDAHYRKLIEGAQPMLAEGAAYGAVVVQACKALADLHEVKADNPPPQGITLEDVGREVRVVSPLLLDRLDKVREISGGVGATSQPEAPAISLDGVPVEGSAQEPVGASGATSPLLEGRAAERMLHRLEREGYRVVQRAQLEGADVALAAMTVKRKPAASSKAQGCDSAGCSPFFPDEETEND